MITKRTIDNSIDLYFDNVFNFIETFNKNNGNYVRSDDTEGNDPFMRSYPALVDCGIMGSCVHGKSGLCVVSGVECYQNGLNKFQNNMPLNDFKEIINQVSGKVNTFALGGRGDPNMHESFLEIVKYAKENDVCPTYTTSGLGLTDEQVKITKEFVSAVAVSWYRSQYTLEALDAFTSAGATTNIHYVLSNNSIDEAIDRLEKQNFFGDGRNRINAVIFLLHKPVGLGSQREVLQVDNPKVKRFFEIVDSWNGDFQIGFDSCSIPGILTFSKHIDLNSIDTCEGARFSAYITPDMQMTPCSFDQELKYGVSLREHTIQDAWDSDKFNEFRSHLQNGCKGCSLQSACMSGCPLKQEIVLCNRSERK